MKKQMIEIIVLVLLVVPFAAAAVFWNRLPNQMAIHFNFEGAADAYGGKPFGLLLLPCINLLLYFIFRYLPKMMGSGEQFALLEKRLDVLRLAIHGFITTLYLVILLYTLYQKVNVLLFIAYGIALLMLITGNYLNNIKPNNFMGIRTPWTMKNPEVWRKTHLLTSRLWVIASLFVMCIIPFLPQLQVAKLLLGYFLTITLLPFIYSYVISKRIKTI